jgi:hypothetical protein
MKYTCPPAVIKTLQYICVKESQTILESTSSNKYGVDNLIRYLVQSQLVLLLCNNSKFLVDTLRERERERERRGGEVEVVSLVTIFT